jgi:membrane protease YdiL (CAAX protease family)
MTALRIALVVLAALAAAVPLHLHGSLVWTTTAVLLALSAALALYVLWQDEMLREVMTPKGLDISSGVLGAALLYVAVMLVWFNVVAPSSQLGGLLRKCTLEGPRLPRLDAHGFNALLEWMRAQVCRTYGRSLGVLGPARGAWVVVLAVLEEIAWRGGVQQFLSEKVGSTRGWVATSLLNAALYLVTGNLLLALLVLPCALVWGGLYRYRGRLVPSLASHAVFSYFLFYARPLVDFT